MGFLTIARSNGSSDNGWAGGSILAGIMAVGCMSKSKSEGGILPDLRDVPARIETLPRERPISERGHSFRLREYLSPALFAQEGTPLIRGEAVTDTIS
jgi:hypothetical protein